MSDFIDHSSKRIIRNMWCKPLIKFINDKLSYKLIYMGLPSPDATDILDWIDYLEYIIAFQCRNYPYPSSLDQSKKLVEKLEEKLRELERIKKIKSFSLYDGYIEEVVLMGRDTIGRDFSQKEFITLYNLDFCNNINSPVQVLDEDGNLHLVYKSEVIEKLIKLQNEIKTTKPKKFIMFLTVHVGFYNGEEVFFKRKKMEEIESYHSKIKKIIGPEKTLLLLRAYIFALLKKYFISFGFVPEFLPVINYRHGSKGKWLLVFTIVGTFNDNDSSAECFQQTQDLLNQNFLTIDKNKIVSLKLKNFSGRPTDIDPIKIFKSSETYKKLWN